MVDLIAQIGPRPFQAALQQADANLARDQADGVTGIRMVGPAVASVRGRSS
jgi:hypothetical protein